MDILFRARTTQTERTVGPNGVSIAMEFSKEPTIETFEFIKLYADLRIFAIQEDAAKLTRDDMIDDAKGPT